ncbi:cyclopropane-fatty-acyl-phospholipid synthase family protein [Pelagibius sp. Alg239-R121]|uniref:SAM-dependent methyltransferase n=1 Tax=Pelagibius sp. Alg239-R121 TaxID=2993448 RepID=UPI0024A65411|nr:cyclopropane-fatty-acyl-phospholipid synthase family protein [Pelagibius sp. Alg239-R121]
MGLYKKITYKQIHKLLNLLGSTLHKGSILIYLPDGSTTRFAADLTGPNAEIHITSQRFFSHLVMGGHLGFADAFVAGEFHTPNLVTLLEFGEANQEAWDEVLVGRPLPRLMSRIQHLLNFNSRNGSRRNISQHYDLGNNFYRNWLDESLTYSSAIFAKPDEPLDTAQSNKYRHLAEMAHVGKGQHVLEIGCGWGGFASYLAREHDCKVTAVTISDEQYKFARQRIQADGLNERVEILRRDYRDIEGSFDRVLSIEMLEAVGVRYWPIFFDKLRNSLKPGGVAALQVITIADHAWDDYSRNTEFIQRHIFPGGMLPSPEIIAQQSARAGLEYRNENGFGWHYAETLRRWRYSFDAAWPSIASLGFDEHFRRLWTYYLAYCEAGFNVGRIDVKQFALQRPT